jgi:hypothetical protein
MSAGRTRVAADLNLARLLWAGNGFATMGRPRREPEVLRAEVRELIQELYRRLIGLGLTREEATALVEVAKRDAVTLLDFE